jgi:tetratricopeptide (TPR) repeat protein
MKPELDEPFAERIERLKQELELAIRWDRPSILLAIYSSEFVRADAEAALEAWLREQGQEVARIQVTKPADADVPLRLREWPDHDRTVFFVSGLQWGEPTSWNALNIRREYLVEDRVRAIFWLTEGEAAELPRRAPDFWAFRHRTVEFVEPPEPGRAAAVAREFAWRGLEDRTLREDTEAKIALREALLADLPEADETLAARAELQYTLGGLYWANRRYEQAEESLYAALEGMRRTSNTRMEARCHNGLGNVYGDLGRQDEAIAAHQRAIELDPTFATPHNNLGVVYSDLGRQDEAIAAFQRAIELDPDFAAPHNNLGSVYRRQGRYEEAVAAFQRAIELDLTDAYPHNNLGNVYRDLGRQEEAIAAYRRAIELDPDFALPHGGLAGIYRRLEDEAKQQHHLTEARRLIDSDDHGNLACLESIAGNVDTALEHLGKALEKTPGLRALARRDPDLASIRDDPRFRELVGSTSDRGNIR